MPRTLLFIPLMLLICAGIAESQVSYPRGSMTSPTTVALLPAIGNSNLLYDVRDAATATTCASGGGTFRVICHWTGSAYERVAAGASVGTVTSVSASGGTETTTGSAITSSGTIRSAETVDARTAATEALLDAARGRLVTFGNAGATAVSIAQAGAAGNFASGWYCDVKVVGAGTVTITPVTSTIDGSATLVLTQGQKVRIQSNGTNYITGIGNTGAGITNTAPSGTIPKSVDGSGNLGASDATNPSAGLVVVGNTTNTGQLKLQGSSGDNSNSVTLKPNAGEDPNQDITLTFFRTLPLSGSDFITVNSSGGLERQTLITSAQGGTGADTSASSGVPFVSSGAWGVIPAAGTGTVLSLPVNNTVLATATGTIFTSPGNAGTPLSVTTEAAVSFPAPRGGVLFNLFVRTGTTAKVNTPATVITVRINGVNTLLSVTMTQTTTTTTSDVDPSHAAAVVAGDLITVSLTTTGAAAVSTSIAGITFAFREF